ncbi:MAG TPA: hypothetical protein PLL26_02405 [Candidatus Dojkabacteria bacterium]|nr:hypothetical protein [Candidatus Dojkabacteria bacterium]
MNITGYGQYSKQVAGIRDPNKIMNQQHKLIFIYPMLFADRIKVPNLETLLRDFISVTFLSDLFVQNTLNVIGIANQIRPLWDENKQLIDPTTAIIRSLGNSEVQGAYTSTPVMPNYPVSPEHATILQQKINQKTAYIQQLLKTDPKFSKLRPFIEIITLGNMIEVPVIVGTTSYPTDTLSLMYVLIAAIGLNRKLNNKQDVDAIFRELETMNESKYWNLLNNLIQSPTERADIADWFRDKAFKVTKSISGWRNVPTISGAAENLATRLQKRIMNPPKLNQANELLSPLFINQTNLAQTKLYFQFVLDPDFAKRRFGIDASDEDTKLVDLSSAKLQGELANIQRFIRSNFSEVIGTIGVVLLRSIINIITVSPTSVDFSKLKKEHIDADMVNNIDDDLNEVLKAIDHGLKGSSSEESRNKIKILKSLCQIDTSNYISEFSKLIATHSIHSDDFNMDIYKNFLSTFDSIVSSCSTLSAKIENEVKFLTSDNEKSILLNRLNIIQQDISESLLDFFQPYQQEVANASGTDYVRIADITNVSYTDIANKMIPKFRTGLADIFYFLLLAQLQTSLCKFVLTADVDLETTSNEVTSWPNYILVLPVEIVLALHAAMMGVSWKHMLQGGEYGRPVRKSNEVIRDTGTGTQVTIQRNKPLTHEQISTKSIYNVNEQYVKGIIKVISQRIGVPNLIVVDSRRGHIYYKLMNQTDINRTNISTIDTFIRSKLNRQMVSQF